METTVSEKKETTIQEGKKKWQKRGMLFLKFLAYGGWILMAIVVLAIFFLIAALRK